MPQSAQLSKPFVGESVVFWLREWTQFIATLVIEKRREKAQHPAGFEPWSLKSQLFEPVTSLTLYRCPLTYLKFIEIAL